MRTRSLLRRAAVPTIWLAGVAAAIASTFSAAAGDDMCRLEREPRLRAVVAVPDAETLTLDDGENVHLVGAMPPRSPDPADDAVAWPPAEDAARHLGALVLARSVALARVGTTRDRYGRITAHVFVQGPDGRAEWVQGAMLAAGHARAYALPGVTACLGALIATERPAREERRGLWAHAAYGVRDATDTRDLLARTGSFALVAGTVSRVKATAERVYLDFGADWRRDFTVSVPTAVLRAHPDWAAGLSEYAGARVQVRGWITARNGPMIEISDPGELELLDAPAAVLPRR